MSWRRIGEGLQTLNIAEDRSREITLETEGTNRTFPFCIFFHTSIRSTFFNAEIDAQSGYRTKSILCLPVMTSNDHMVGVIEMINKLDDNGDLLTFSKEDELVLSNFTDVVRRLLRREEGPWL